MIVITNCQCIRGIFEISKLTRGKTGNLSFSRGILGVFLKCIYVNFYVNYLQNYDVS